MSTVQPFTGRDFELKNLEQISRKHEATMGIITAKADTERALLEVLTAKLEAWVRIAYFFQSVPGKWKSEKVSDAFPTWLSCKHPGQVE